MDNFFKKEDIYRMHNESRINTVVEEMTDGYKWGNSSVPDALKSMMTDLVIIHGLSLDHARMIVGEICWAIEEDMKPDWEDE